MPNLKGVINNESVITFVLSKPIKQTKAGIKSVHIECASSPADHTLCVVITLKEYLACTEGLRRHCKQMFISYLKPFHPVSRSTIGRWVRKVGRQQELM